MKKTLSLILAICIMALGVIYILGQGAKVVTPTVTTNAPQTLEQTAPEEPWVIVKYQEIEKRFNFLGKDPVVGDNWAREILPGEERSSNQITEDLHKMETLLGELSKLPPSARYPELKHDVLLAVAHEMTSLLVVARRDQDLGGLEAFLKFASKMDTPAETFGIKPKELRAEALVMAQREVATLRPRLREGSGDARGYLQHILRAWQFSPNQLGLTKEDMKEVADK